MSKEFYNNLIDYASKAKTTNANNLLMGEVGKSLARRKNEFVELLQSNGVDADPYMSDVELVDNFVQSLPNNKALMISTAYMINKNNGFVNADGKQVISDNGVKLSYKMMNDFFTKEDTNAIEYSNVSGDVIAGAVTAGAGLADTLVKGSQKKKYGALDLAQQQAQARSEILKSLSEQKKIQAEAAKTSAENKAKTKKILLIGGISVLALAGIGFLIYKLKKK